MDFTLGAYQTAVCSGLDAGYRLGAVTDWFDGKLADTPYVLLLRHDVDRRPRNALAMAKAEAALGVRSTYYFRIGPESFAPDIVREIAGLGHEIGYHYEDWHRARFDKARAIALFADALAQLRAIAEVRTISMHGSPLSRENNMNIWNHWRFDDHGVKDCVLSHHWREFVYVTDAGRTLGSTGANLRDELGEASGAKGVKTTEDMAKALKERRHAYIMLSTHPERWSDDPMLWTSQWAKDSAINTIKFGLRAVRPVTAQPIIR